jgi:hypothetical protein
MDYSNFGINDLVFNTNKNGDLMGGGFVIQSELLKDTIQSGQELPSQSGGSVVDGASKVLLNTFKDLAVPAGLFFTQKQVQKNNTIKYEHKTESIGEGIYDKLLGMLEPSKRKLHGRKTRSKRENNKKKTRKQR